MSFADQQIFGPRAGLIFVTVIGLLLCVGIGVTMGSNSVLVVITIGRSAWPWPGSPWQESAGGYWFRRQARSGAIFGSALNSTRTKWPSPAVLLPLILAMALRHSKRIENRSPFPIVLYLLSFYLLAHWLGSNIYNKLDGGGGYGNVTRAYFNAYWVIIFLIAFWRYGSTDIYPGRAHAQLSGSGGARHHRAHHLLHQRFRLHPGC